MNLARAAARKVTRPVLVVLALYCAVFSANLTAGQRADFALDLSRHTNPAITSGGLHDVSRPHRSEFLRVQQQGISKDEAAARVKRQYGGKILAISEVQKNGRAMYRVKGLSDKSQVYVVFVDKQSGRISR